MITQHKVCSFLKGTLLLFLVARASFVKENTTSIDQSQSLSTIKANEWLATKWFQCIKCWL